MNTSAGCKAAPGLLQAMTAVWRSAWPHHDHVRRLAFARRRGGKATDVKAMCAGGPHTERLQRGRAGAHSGHAGVLCIKVCPAGLHPERV